MPRTPTLVSPNGLELRRLRETFGLTQRELAERANCSKRTIERAEASRTVNPKWLLAIATVLSTTPEKLRNPFEADSSLGTKPNAQFKELRQILAFLAKGT